jgi:hypothetical protein
MLGFTGKTLEEQKKETIMKKRLLNGCAAFLLLFGLFSLPVLQAAERPQNATPALKAAQTHQEFETAATGMVQAESAFARALESGLQGAAVQHKMADQMASVQKPEILIPKFLQEWKKARDLDGGFSSLAKTGSMAASLTSGISGKVMVNGEMPSYPVYVLAFDEYGYYRGDCGSPVTETDGEYTIPNLPPGAYYIMTVSERYVNEIYNNQISPLDSRETWRQAEKIVLQDGQVATGIDFDLQSGAELTGMIFRFDGSPVQGMDLSFVFTLKDAPVPVYSVQTSTSDGTYFVAVPLSGEYKVSVQVPGEASLRTWYPDKASWAEGAVVTIPDYAAKVNDLNFTLAPYPPGMEPGSISGLYRWSDTAQLISIATAFLFNASDSSLVDFTLGLLGSYQFAEVPPGEYFLYLDDQLGNLIGGANYLGQFYAGAQTPGEATLIKVDPGEEVVLNDIVLEPGGVISGTIKTALGKPLDGVWVMAIDASLLDLELGPWLSNLHLFIGQADARGAYKIAGMPTGKYILRTISDTLINQNLLDIIKIESGAHAGEVVDAYYGGSANLFNPGSATPVEVVAPNETAHIDFSLEKAKWIRGRVSDAVDESGKKFYRLFALNDTSAYPFLSLGMLIHNNQMDDNGNYRLGPLPSGTYKILAMAPVTGFNNYLSEMYGGARDFESARVITVGTNDIEGADIKVDRGAQIQGFVDLPQEGGGTIRAGADVLDGFPVIAYEATTGALASLDFVQFSGGYKIDRLLPGTYRILALPAVAPYAATYYGGGDSFDDAGTGSTVTVGYGETANCDIVLEKGTGAISGFVRDATTTSPLSQVMVIAYDKTGHPVGLSMSDMELASGQVTSETGQFLVGGLRPGGYYLRTYAVSSVLGFADQLLSLYNSVAPGEGEETDYMDLLFGGGLSSLGSLFSLDMTVYGDQWYNRVPAQLELNLNNFALNLLAYGMPSGYDNALLPIYLPMPLAENIPATATPIAVGDGATVAGIEFNLSEGTLSDVISDVEERTEVLPERFTVHANYPNPFNPSTTLAFDLPAAGEVKVSIYNALGQPVRLLQEGSLPAGTHRLQWDGRSDSGEVAPSGLYFARFQTADAQRTVKMVMLK